MVVSSAQILVSEQTGRQCDESTKVDSECRDIVVRETRSLSLARVDQLPQLDLESWVDLFSAYRLSMAGLTKETQAIYLQQLRLSKRTMPYLLEVILSNRHPYTIIKIAHKIGMYIPPRERIGLKAYRFFLHNINYYEPVFDRSSQSVPSFYEIFLSRHPVALLMKFRDDEILQGNYIFNRNFSDRRQMIEDFLERNITNQGKFELDSNSRRSYSGRAKIITFTQTLPMIREQKDGDTQRTHNTQRTQEKQRTLHFTVNELLKLVDLRQGLIWKDIQKRESFSRLSLHHLRQQILMKFQQWRHRDMTFQFNGPPELKQLLDALEIILAADDRNDTGAYLGYPQIAVSF